MNLNYITFQDLSLLLDNTGMFCHGFSYHFQENDLKKALKIRYVGGGEEGLDLGGLQKEFFHVIINDILQPGMRFK